MHADRSTDSAAPQLSALARAALALRTLFPTASTRAIGTALRGLGMKFREDDLRQILRGTSVPIHEGTSVPEKVVALRPGRTRDAAGRNFPSRGTHPDAPGTQCSASTRTHVARGVRSNTRDHVEDQAEIRSSLILSASQESLNASSLRSLAGDVEVFALEQETPTPKRAKGYNRTPYAGSLLPKPEVPPAVLAAADLCSGVWARLERHGEKPRGVTFTRWRAKNTRAAQDIFFAGVSSADALEAWERCLRERRLALYSIFALQAEIARQAAEDRDRGGGAAGMGYTDAELDEE